MGIHPDAARLNAMRIQDAGQVHRGHGLTVVPCAPGPRLARIEEVQQDRSGTAMLVFVGEDVADVREQMQETSLGCILTQDPEPRISSVFRHLAADEVGTMEEGFQQVLLARSEVGRELVTPEGEGFMQGAGVLHSPAAEPGQQGRGLCAGLRGIETIEGLIGLWGMQDDRDGEAVYGRGKDRHAGEGLGAEDVGEIGCGLAARSISAALRGATDQQAADLLVRAAEDGLTFIKQDGGAGAQDSPGESDGSRAGCIPGVVADQAEQFQAKGLTALLFPRTYIEIGRGAKGRIAVSVDRPDAEQAKLVRSGAEIFLEESPEAKEHLVCGFSARGGRCGYF